MRLAIVGPRDFNGYSHFKRVIDEYISNNGQPTVIISEGAGGAGSLAEQYAREKQIPLRVYNADWDTYGKSAGPRRNSQIVADCTHCVAFCSINSVGTKDTINKARKSGKTVTVIDMVDDV